MGAMYRLKAYFGMVPAEELGEYADDPERYLESRRERSSSGYANERWDDRFTYEDESDPGRRDRYDDDWDRRAARPVVGRSGRRPAARPGVGSPGSAEPLAIDPDAARNREPVRSRCRPAVPEQRERPATGAAALTPHHHAAARAATRGARTIGERYRDGVPVIMNLTELDAADGQAARRLRRRARLRAARRLRQGHQPGLPAHPGRRRGVGGRRADAGRAQRVRWRVPDGERGFRGECSTGSRPGLRTCPSPSSSSLYYVLFFFWLLLVGRIVAELVRSFARQWVPAGSQRSRSRTDLHSHRPACEVVAESDPRRPDRRRGTGLVDYGSAAGRVHTDERCPADAVVSPSHTVPPPRTA